jgi:putative ABC transport system permease protein
MRFQRWLDDLGGDVRFGLRQLRRSPGFACAAILTLALGIGANCAVFTLADAALLRPLPFPDADRLALIWERRLNGGTTMAAPAEAREWAARARAFEAMAFMAIGAGATWIDGDGTPTLLSSQTVSRTFFDVLGVRPLLGRTFVEADEGPSPAVVVLSEPIWRTRFGADPSLVGRTLVLNGGPATIVGIVPATAQVVPPFVAGASTAAEPAALWLLAGSGGGGADRAHFVHVVARIRRGLPIDTAAAEMTGIADVLARESPSTNAGHGVLVQPLRDALIGPEVRSTALVLTAVVGFPLLMCCANVAHLLLARTSARARELAVRSALGAARRRLAAQLLTESLVLALLGGVVGAALSAGLLRAAPHWMPIGLLPNAVTLPFDGRVTAFCGLAAMLAGVLFGCAPAWQATGVSLAGAASAAGRATRRGGISRALVVLEVAAAVLVLIGSGLLLRTWTALGRVDPGYRTRDAFTAVVNLPFPGPASPQRYQRIGAVQQFYDAVERDLRAQPAVRRVAWGSALPLAGGWFGQPILVEGDQPRRGGQAEIAAYQMVSRDYFDVLGIPILRGRAFAAGDAADGPPVCIVSEAFVKQYLGGRDPLARRVAVPQMQFGPQMTVMRQIVGVARQVKDAPNEPRSQPQLYVPLAQNAWWSASLVVEAASGPPELLAPVIRSAVARADRTLPLRQVRSLQEVAAAATERPRFRALLVTAFAVLGVGLAMVGIFGVLAYTVSQRTREFGVRLAFGAQPAAVLTLVVGDAARSVGTGLALGLLLSAGLARSIRSVLFGVQPIDPITLVAVVLVIAATAAVAVAVPAARALRVDPVVTFRTD